MNRRPFHSLRHFASRPNSSGAWLHRHKTDKYVRQSFIDDYRSRGAYKLLQIHEKYPFMKPGQVVLDCGAAPGGWSQVATQLVDADGDFAVAASKMARNETSVNINDHGSSEKTVPGPDWSINSGLVVSVDMLSMQPITGAVILRGDFRQHTTIDLIMKCKNNRPFDVIISDMAPNLTGQREADHWNSMELCRTVLRASQRLGLKNNGTMLFKIMQGGMEAEFRNELRGLFQDVRFVKPAASRKESKEIFLLCRGFN